MKSLKRFLQHNFPETRAYNFKNLVGDSLVCVYNTEKYQVWYCEEWDYLEIFGLTTEEYLSMVDTSNFKQLRPFDEGIDY